MKIVVDRFKSNNPELKPSDIVWGFSGADKKNGVACLNFKTRDKYHHIITDITINTQEYSGQGIIIEPIIIDSGWELSENDQVAYVNHPDWYSLQMCVITDVGRCISVYTPLKHEYSVTFIEYPTAFGYGRTKDLEVV